MKWLVTVGLTHVDFIFPYGENMLLFLKKKKKSWKNYVNDSAVLWYFAVITALWLVRKTNHQIYTELSLYAQFSALISSVLPPPQTHLHIIFISFVVLCDLNSFNLLSSILCLWLDAHNLILDACTSFSYSEILCGNKLCISCHPIH